MSAATRIFYRFQELLDVLWTGIPSGGLLKRSGNNVGPATGIGIVTLNGSGVQGTITQPTDLLVDLSSAQRLTNKTINGSENTVRVRLDSVDVVNNLPVSRITPAPGDLFGPATAVDSEISIYSGTTGKTLKRATGTGVANVTNGVWQAPLDPNQLSGLPVGAIIDYAGTVEPSGWLFCWGQLLNRTGIYAPLYQAIGVAWGAGDGTLTFQLPDFRGRVSAGRDNMGGTSANRLTISLTCSTTNGSTTLTATGGGFNPPMCEGMLVIGNGIPAGTKISYFNSSTQAVMTLPATLTQTGVSLRFGVVDGATVGASGGAQSHQLDVAQMPSHSHTFNDYYQALAYPGSNMQPGAANVSYTLAGYYTGNGTAGAGGDQAHSNMQPTVVCNKIIKYTVGPAVSPPSPGTGDVVGPSNSVDGEVCIFSGTSGKFIRRGTIPNLKMPRGHIVGLRTSNNQIDQVNDIDIGDGECRDSTNSEDMVLPAPLTKRIDLPWAVGTDQGGLDGIGTLANLSYHIFVIKRIDTGVVDVLFSPSAVNPMLPVGYGYKRRIGSFIRAAGVINLYLQEGDYFYKDAPEIDPGVYNLSVGAAGVTTILQSVPLGIKGHVIASMMTNVSASTGTNFLSGDLSNTASAVYGPYADTSANWSNTGYPVMFNTSGQIKVKTDRAALVYMSVYGWIDPRGRND